MINGRKGVGVCLMAAIAMISVSVADLDAQSAPTRKGPSVSLGIASGAPGQESELQLKLDAPPDLKIGKLDAVLTYADGALKFEKVSGYLLDLKKIVVEAEEKPPANGQRTLLVSVRSAAPDTSLPIEPLVTIVFTAEEATKPGVLDVDLKATALALNGGEIAPLAVYPGRINIQELSVFFGCFFYMH
jgi:hypothetical protein